jgi:hypothetical protein
MIFLQHKSRQLLLENSQYDQGGLTDFVNKVAKSLREKEPTSEVTTKHQVKNKKTIFIILESIA